MYRLDYGIIFSLLLGIFSIRVQAQGYFWHITDTHVDQNYSRTGNPNSLCHQEDTNFPDVGLYGNFLCDSPQYLINVTVAAMHSIHAKPNFIIWTGDNLPHTKVLIPNWNVTFEAIKNTTLLLTSTFPNVSILPSIGNHDTFPPNLLLPDGPVYEGFLKQGAWEQLLTKDEQTTFLQGGFYSHVVKPGLRIISLNTILWYITNSLTSHMTDPANQFQWLEGVLNTSSRMAEKVYIIGHVPPGYYNYPRRGTKNDLTYHEQHITVYLQILSKYSRIIIGQMYGHLHLDMFQVFQYNTGTFQGSSVLASSVTPWHEKKYKESFPVNPSVRLMHYSPTNFTLLDYDQYYLNLTQANSMNRTVEAGENLFEKLYRFSEAYDVKDLSTESLVQVFEKLKNNDVLFRTFFLFLTAGKYSIECDNYCKTAQLCSMSCIGETEYDLCMKSPPTPPTHLSFVLIGGIIILLLGLSCCIFYLFQKYWRRSRQEYDTFSRF